MPKIDYRDRARRHVKAAKELLAQPGEDAARYACLRLRMAIEALSYQTLEAYLSEAPHSIMTKWQPRKVIDELLAIDPHADKTAKIYFGLEETPGVPAAKMDFLGEDKRFTVKWGNSAHNALGNFLHEPTIDQQQKGQADVDVAARSKANEVLAELEAILAAPLFNVNFGNFVSFDCSCGVTVRRKPSALEGGKPVSCINCGRLWTQEPGDTPDTWKFKPDVTTYECETCKSTQGIATHLLAKLPKVKCATCGTERQIVQGYLFE